MTHNELLDFRFSRLRRREKLEARGGGHKATRRLLALGTITYRGARRDGGQVINVRLPGGANVRLFSAAGTAFELPYTEYYSRRR